MQLFPSDTTRVFVGRYLWQMIAIHAAVLFVAPFYFSWTRLLFAMSLAMWMGHCLGMFHHMLLSHRSFKCPKIIEYFGVLIATLTWRGPMAAPIRYVAMHRVHHMYSDKDQDPHSPIHGNWHAFIGWFWRIPTIFIDPKRYERLAPDIAKDRFLRFLDRNVDLVQAVWALVLFFIAGFASMIAEDGRGFDFENAVGFAIYGVFVKSLLVIYFANAVDVINHTIGYRNYATKDTSTNSALMGMVHLGGAISWHNNHHAHPGYFKVKANWWEIDIHHLILKMFEKMGLASDIKELYEPVTASETSTRARRL